MGLPKPSSCLQKFKVSGFKSVPKSTQRVSHMSPGIMRIRKKTSAPSPNTVGIISRIRTMIYLNIALLKFNYYGTSLDTL